MAKSHARDLERHVGGGMGDEEKGCVSPGQPGERSEDKQASTVHVSVLTVKSSEQIPKAPCWL